MRCSCEGFSTRSSSGSGGIQVTWYDARAVLPPVQPRQGHRQLGRAPGPHGDRPVVLERRGHGERRRPRRSPRPAAGAGRPSARRAPPSWRAGRAGARPARTAAWATRGSGPPLRRGRARRRAPGPRVDAAGGPARGGGHPAVHEVEGRPRVRRDQRVQVDLRHDETGRLRPGRDPPGSAPPARRRRSAGADRASARGRPRRSPGTARPSSGGTFAASSALIGSRVHAASGNQAVARTTTSVPRGTTRTLRPSSSPGGRPAAGHAGGPYTGCNSCG